MKKQVKSPEKELNEMEASNLLHSFKKMFIRMLKELSGNYTSMKKDIDTISVRNEEYNISNEEYFISH